MYSLTMMKRSNKKVPTWMEEILFVITCMKILKITRNVLFLFLDMEVDGESDTHPSGMVNGHTDTDTTKTDSDQKGKSKLRLSFEDYRSMARTIAGHLRAEEYKAGEGKF